jgi:hypothetical protein
MGKNMKKNESLIWLAVTICFTLFLSCGSPMIKISISDYPKEYVNNHDSLEINYFSPGKRSFSISIPLDSAYIEFKKKDVFGKIKESPYDSVSFKWEINAKSEAAVIDKDKGEIYKKSGISYIFNCDSLNSLFPQCREMNSLSFYIIRNYTTLQITSRRIAVDVLSDSLISVSILKTPYMDTLRCSETEVDRINNPKNN